MPFLTPVIYVKLAFDDHKIFSFYLQFCSLKSRLKMLNNIKLKALYNKKNPNRFKTRQSFSFYFIGSSLLFLLLFHQNDFLSP